MSEDTRNVWKRINAVKKGLRNTSLKKSGKNTFSKYEYMELNDFENALEDLCDKEGINTMFFWFTDKAVLRITNVDDPKDTVEVCSPVVDCGIKGASPIQNLGGMQTYLRRYLFTSTFGIAEHDIIEQQAPENKQAGEWKQSIPAQQPQPQASPNGKETYLALISHFGFNKAERDSEKSKTAVDKAKEWMAENLGAVINPLQFTPEQVDKTLSFLNSQGPESFVDDELR